MNIKVKVYNKIKYLPESEKVAEIEYSNIKKMEIKTLEDKEIFAMGFDMVDEYKEYCFITFANGETATFRNSYVDVFKV